MNAVLERLSKIGIVPVVKIDRVEDAVPLAKALIDGGLPAADQRTAIPHPCQIVRAGFQHKSCRSKLRRDSGLSADFLHKNTSNQFCNCLC